MTNKFSCVTSIVVLLLAAAPLFAQQDNVSMQELQQCRDLQDPAERMACYDNIGAAAAPAPAAPPPVEAVSPAAAEPAATPPVEQPAPAEAAETTTAAPAAAAEEYGELTDDVGLPKSGEDLQLMRATVARCGEANNRRFYFYFDNGQVWKYLGRKKLRFLDCENQATLIEDGFGFTLKIDGDEREMRVQRVK